MRTLATLLVLLVPIYVVGAEDGDDLLKRARELDQRAEKLLDQGRRAEAFALLARASELRAEARGERQPAPAAADKPQPQKKKRKKAKAAPKKDRPRNVGKAANASLERLDKALEQGDMRGARAAASQTRNALARWAKDLAERERKLKAGPKGMPDRITTLENRVEKLRAELERLIVETHKKQR